MDADMSSEQPEAEAAAPPPPVHPPAVQDLHRPILRVDRTGGATAAARHFLLPVDDTDDSEAAIRWAVDNIARPGDVLHLLHVIPEPSMVHIWGGAYIPPDEDAELVEVEDTKSFVKHRFAKFLVERKVPFQLHVIVGPTDPEAVARVCAKKAGDVGAAAVVLGKHSKGRLKEYWVGSVTKALVAQSPVPVAVVPHGFND